MTKTPENLRYTATHEWVRIENDHTITVGITDFAQSQLGDLVYVELPKINKTIKNSDEIAVVESVKTAADIYSPVSGTIIAINEELNTNPENINKDPYGRGWLFRMNVADPAQLDQLLDAKNYQKQTEPTMVEK